MPSYTFWNYSKTQVYQCTNHNAFLGMMDGALTGKTGFTGNAGYCYVGALQWEGKTLIVSLLACGWPNNRGYKWEDTRKLMTYGLTNYEYREVFEKKELGRLAVVNGQKKGTAIDDDATTRLEYGADMEQMHLSLLLRKDEQITVRYQLPAQLEAPGQEGTAGRGGAVFSGRKAAAGISGVCGRTGGCERLLLVSGTGRCGVLRLRGRKHEKNDRRTGRLPGNCGSER